MAENTDNARVYFPPPLIYLSGLLVGGLMSWFFHFPVLPNLVAKILGISLLVIGLGVILKINAMMSKAKTDIKPWKPTTAILSDGLFGISRNPIYVALALIYVGIGVFVNSALMFPPLLLVLIAVNFYVIGREEKYLESKFGDAYLNYKKEVRRWI